MPKVLNDLLLSKKFVVALLTCLGSIAAYAGWHVDPMVILPVVAPLLAYIGAQGWADSGKEQAKIAQETMTRLSAAPSPGQGSSNNSTTNPAQAGFARASLLGTMAILSMLAVVLVVSCARSGQVTLKFGQCVLDNHVLGDVAAALQQPDYAQAVERVALADAAELVDCALQALATPSPTAGSGSDSAEVAVRSASAPSSSIAQRAREVLERRRMSH